MSQALFLLYRAKSAKSMTDFQSAFYRDVQPFSGGWTFLLAGAPDFCHFANVCIVKFEQKHKNV